MKLKEFKINHGGKFTPDTAVVIPLDEHKVVGLKGDEGAGKTTVLQILLATCGQIGGEKVIEDLKNLETGKLDSELTFTGNDRADYEVKLTASRLVVRREGEIQGEPKALLKKLLGVVGVSPMKVKDADVEDIVKWLAQYSARGADDFLKQMRKLKDDIKVSRDARADANRAAKARKELLLEAGYLDNEGQLIEKTWTAAEKKYSQKLDTDELGKKLNAASTKYNKFIENETKVAGQQDRKKQIESQIAALQAELTQVDANIKIGQEWLEKNKAAKKELEAVKSEYQNAAAFAGEYEAFQAAKRQYKELNEYYDLAQKADKNEKTILKKQQELQWEVIPDIKGMELLLEDEVEDGTRKKAGFYMNGVNSRQMSESQWFDTVVKILKKNKVPIILIDGVANLGSGFMETLEGLKKAGIYIVYTEMARGQETLELELQ